MLKQYKLLSYFMGVLLCNFLAFSSAFAQTTEPVKETKVIVCNDESTAVDLFKELEVQISPDNGYWVDSKGDVLPDNIFLTDGLPHGSYDFIFKVTSDAYCAPAGSEFLVTVVLRLNDLKTNYSVQSPQCDSPTGVLQIDTITTEFGSGTYIYSLVAENTKTGEKTTISNPVWGQVPNGTGKENPFVVNTSLASQDSVIYYLYVKDQIALNCGNSVDTIKLDMKQVQISVNFIETVDGYVVAEASGGTAPYRYEWRADSVDVQPFFVGDTLKTGLAGETYYVTAYDKFGCFDDSSYTIIGRVDTAGIVSQYFFCQNDNMELFTHTQITDYTLEQLLFATLPSNIAAEFEGATIKVFDDPTTPITSNVNLLETLRRGENVVTYVEITTADGKAYNRQKITITMFKAPTLDLKVLNDRIDGEYELEDLIQLEASVRQGDINIDEYMLWYKYYLNGQLKSPNKGTDERVFPIRVLDFTGATNELLKLEVAQQVAVPKGSVDSVCIWDKTISKTITIPFPNAFTPDGDGINDVFLGDMSLEQGKYRDREFHLEIINRWGNLLYSGNKGWDGTHKGSLVTPGTYFYIVQLKGSDGVSRTIKGSVTLILKQ